MAFGQAVPQVATLDFLADAQATKGLRLNGDFYAPTNALGRLGFSYSVVAGKASVVTPRGSIAVQARTLDGKTHVPLRFLCESLGLHVEWSVEGSTLKVRNPITRLTAGPDGFAVAAAGEGLGDLTLAERPKRIVLDFVGYRLPASAEITLAPGTRAMQFDDRLVRVVIESERRPKEGKFKVQASASQDWQGISRPLAKPLTYEQMTLATEFPTFSHLDPVVITDVVPRQTLTRLGEMRIVNEGARSALLALNLPAPLGKPVQFSRPEATVIEVFVPSARPAATPKFDSKLVESSEVIEVPGGTTLRLNLTRPLGAELTQNAKAIQFLLTVPRNQDGHVSGKVIVVDPGHGAHDSGARDPGKTTNEKDLNLNISKHLAQKLADMGATVIMTRKTDIFIPLRERAEIANRNQADLFVSVHINSNKRNNSTSGTIIFYHGGDPIGQLLADCVRVETAKTGYLKSIGTWSDRRIYDTGFAVLRYSNMPGILVETGFINHGRDLSVMKSAKFQEDFAEAIAKGVKVFFSDGR